MSKRLTERTDAKLKNADRRPTAIAKYIRIPSSKMELVLDLIRGKSYTEAAAILKNTNKSSSPVVLKVLESAAANAENNLSIIKDSLFVAECYAMAGPTLKRMQPRARGRADRILKRTCHVRIILDTKEDKKKAVSKKVEKKTEKAEKEMAAKAITKTVAEKPLAEKPNTVKPLGTKPLDVKASAAKSVSKPTAKAKPAAAGADKKAAGKPKAAAAKQTAVKKPAAPAKKEGK
jgi:large subunit ribosomal protein L22